MAERPILFSAPMVRAILAGTKTQTRRAIKPPRDHEMPCAPLDERDIAELLAVCPYGQPGDRLWVREAVWMPRPVTARDLREGADTWPKCIYSADTDDVDIEWMREHRWKQRPSIHCPRWASRITLEVTDVRVERLQDISEADAIAEGVDGPMCAELSTSTPWRDVLAPVAVHTYAALWDSINGAGAWLANPWVWVVSFQRVDASTPRVAEG